MLDKATIENLLTALGKQIESIKEGPINIAVCGGASLNVLGQVMRTTKDIDIMGIVRREESGKFSVEEAVLPQWFMDAADRVKRDFNLPVNWINVGPTSIVRREIEQAALWSMTHDVSENFQLVLKDLLKKLGFKNVSEKI